MKRSRWVAAGLATSALLLAWLGGCVSTPLPRAADAGTQAARVELDVGVEAARVEPFSDELVRALRATQLFARVDRIDRFPGPPDLVARVESGWRGNAAIPFFTALSLGLVPTIVDETYGLAFSLRAPGAREGVAIDARWQGKVWLGFPSALLNASPNRTAEDWRKHPRWIAHLRRSVIQRASEIEAIAR